MAEQPQIAGTRAFEAADRLRAAVPLPGAHRVFQDATVGDADLQTVLAYTQSIQ